MKLGPVTKHYKKNFKKKTKKKMTMTFMSTNYDVIVIFPIYGQSGAMQKPDSE